MTGWRGYRGVRWLRGPLVGRSTRRLGENISLRHAVSRQAGEEESVSTKAASRGRMLPTHIVEEKLVVTSHDDAVCSGTRAF